MKDIEKGLSGEKKIAYTWVIFSQDKLSLVGSAIGLKKG